MKLKQLSVENIENLTNKMIDIKTLTFTPNEFVESSMICSEELHIKRLKFIGYCWLNTEK